MADPIRVLTDWPAMCGRRTVPSVTVVRIIRQDPLRQAVRLIAKHHLRVWFEPNWRTGRMLAKRFPHCLICSIPEESDTASLRKIPGWRPRTDNGSV